MKKKVKKAKSKVEATPADAKTVLKNAQAELTTFLKENKLARDDDHSKNKKFGTQFKELTLAVEKAQAELEGASSTGKAKADKKEKKAKTGGSKGTPQKYDYPEGMTADEKKKYRVKMRAEANKAEGGKKTAKTAKAEKAEKTESSSKATKATSKTKDAPSKSKKKKAKKSSDD